MPKLAIVIPAFKEIFFQQTLNSIAEQSCKDFTLYIGDDASPFDLKKVIDLFQDKISIVYKKFNENLGSKNLVAHWERCIDMVKEEDWIWLFSDDDVMEKTCVENFYRILANSNFDLYHFNINIIDHKGTIVDNFSFPDILDVHDFFIGRNFFQYKSYVVEYIFRKTHFWKMGCFENFDLAWASDDALWIKLGKDKGIKTIPGSRVFWRKSSYNISPNFKDPEILNRKFQAKIQFLKWIYLMRLKFINIEESKLLNLLKNSFVTELRVFCENLTFKKIRNIFLDFNNTIPNIKLKNSEKLHLYSFKIYRHIIKYFKLILGRK